MPLRDGRTYRLRPLGPGDEPLVTEMFATLSPESIRARYGYLIHDMTPDRAQRLVAADPAREVALGLLELAPDGKERLWAMGRLVHSPDNRTAECAFLVHDDRRRLGMATILLRHLRVLGRRRGLPALFAQVRRENRAMLDVFLHNGARLHFDPGGDVVTVDIPLGRQKFLFDKPATRPSPARMSTSGNKGISFAALALDLVLVLGFFTFFYYVLQIHVPTTDKFLSRFWATLAAGCMSGVFWLALQMVKSVLRFQRAGVK
jgi:GNAT superfamily N-acetyltransferase